MHNPLDVTCYNELGLPSGGDADSLRRSLKTPSMAHRLLETSDSPNLPFDVIIDNFGKCLSWHQYDIWRSCPKRVTYAARALLNFVKENPYLYDEDQEARLGLWPNLPLDLLHQLVDLDNSDAIRDLIHNPYTPVEILQRLTTIKPILTDEDIRDDGGESWREDKYRKHRQEAVLALCRKDRAITPPPLMLSSWYAAWDMARHPLAHPVYLEQCIEFGFANKGDPDDPFENSRRLVGDALKNQNMSDDMRKRTSERVKALFERYADHGGGLAELHDLVDYINFYSPHIETIGMGLLYRLFQLDLPHAFSGVYNRLSCSRGGSTEEIEACWATPPRPLFTGTPSDYDEKGVALPHDYRNQYRFKGDARFAPQRPHEELKHLLAIHPRAPKRIVVEAERSAPPDILKIVKEYQQYPQAQDARLDVRGGVPEALDDVDRQRIAKDYAVTVQSFRSGSTPLCLHTSEFNELRRFVDGGCDISELVLLNIEAMKDRKKRKNAWHTLADVLALAIMQTAVYEASAAYALKRRSHTGDLALNRFMPLSILRSDDPRFDGLTADYLRKFGLSEAVRRLATDGHLETRVIIGRNTYTPSDVLDILARDSAMVVRKVVAENCNTSPEALADLAVDPVPGVRRRARGNPNLPQAVPEEAANGAECWEASWSAPYPDTDLWGQALLSWLPETTPGRLGELAHSPQFVLRETALRNPKTPAKDLRNAAGSPDAAIRAAVAGNPACPPTVQRGLAQSPEWYVRWELARNVKAAPDVLLTLIETGDWKIWEEIANHPSLRQRTIADLKVGESAVVVCGCEADDALPQPSDLTLVDPVGKQSDGNRAAIFSALFRTGHPKVLAILEENENVPPDIKMEIAARQSPITYHCHLARTQRLAEEAAVAYAKDFRMVVRHALAQNSALPLAAQKILARDKSPRVLRMLAHTRCLEPSLYAVLAERKIGGKADYTILINLAKNPALPFEVTERLSRSPVGRVRAYVAARHDLSPETIKRLEDDENSLVAESFKTNERKQFRGYHYIETLESATMMINYANPYAALMQHYNNDDDPPELDVPHKFTSPFFLDRQ